MRHQGTSELFKIVLLIFTAFSFAAGAQTRNSVKSKDFPIPLRFDVVGNGLELPPIALQYDLASGQGDRLMLGSIEVSEATTMVNLLPASRLDSRLTKNIPIEQMKDWVFLFQWPENLMQEGHLEVISRTGRVLWDLEIDERARDAWKAQQNAWRDVLLKAKFKKDDIDRFPIFKVQYGLRNVTELNSPFWSLQEPFRFCFTYRQGGGQTRLCTSQYEIRKAKNQPRLLSLPLTPAPPRVILMNESGKLADRIVVPLGKPVQFYAELRSGLSYEFVASPRATNVMDMVEDKSGQFGWITTESDNSPLDQTALLNKENIPEWVEWIGWQQTIGDFRKFWRTKVPLKDSFLMVQGEGGGAFRQDLVISKLPRDEIRPYVEYRTVQTTYVDGAPVFGRKPAQVKLSTNQNSVKVARDKEKFTWEFGADKRWDYNRSYLMVQEGENTYRVFHEMFKGYPRELSFRLSGILGVEEDVNRPKWTIMGELSFNYWFEDLFGWTNYWVRQRMGVSVKSFQTLTNLKLASIDSTLSSQTAEFKYRLTPGLWGRDETWGLLAGYQKFNFDFFDVQMAGAGIFWARSMPKVFDDIFNWFWFLKYPKWVDLEFIYYPIPLTEGMRMARTGVGDWALNFHGQIMFTPSFFGEAGFGLKQYDFSQPGIDSKGRPLSKGFTFTSSYGTVGLGLKF